MTPESFPPEGMVIAPSPASKPDSGLACLVMLAGFHGVAVDERQLQHEFGTEPFTARTLQLAAKTLGLSARLMQQPLERLEQTPLPALVQDPSGEFFVLAGVKRTEGTADQPAEVTRAPWSAAAAPSSR